MFGSIAGKKSFHERKLQHVVSAHHEASLGLQWELCAMVRSSQKLNMNMTTCKEKPRHSLENGVMNDWIFWACFEALVKIDRNVILLNKTKFYIFRLKPTPDPNTSPFPLVKTLTENFFYQGNKTPLITLSVYTSAASVLPSSQKCRSCTDIRSSDISRKVQKNLLFNDFSSFMKWTWA